MAQKTGYVDKARAEHIAEVLHDVPQAIGETAILHGFPYKVLETSVEIEAWGTYRTHYVERKV